MADISPMPPLDFDALLLANAPRAVQLEQEMGLPFDPRKAEAIAREPSCIQFLEHLCESYASRPCLGQRKPAPGEDASPTGQPRLLEAPEYIDYATVWRRIRALSSGLSHTGLVAEGDRVGLCGMPSTEWSLVWMGCLYLQAVSVPLQTGLPRSDLAYIVRQTELSCIACDAEQLELLAGVLPEGCDTVRTLVVMNTGRLSPARVRQLLDTARQELKGTGVSVVLLSELESFGQASFVPYRVPSSTESLGMILYTSGSTGRPKGVIYTEQRMRMLWRVPLPPPLEHLPVSGVVYMPLSHLAGLINLGMCMAAGGHCLFPSSPDMSTLFDDIRLARPTVLLLVPRVSGAIYHHFLEEVARRMHGLAARERSQVEEQVMAEMRGTFLGDRLVYIISSTAPTTAEVKQFFSRCFQAVWHEVNGTTECGTLVANDQRLPHAQLKLVSVPELGYTLEDAPHPRGELLVKGPGVMPGYYENPEANAEAFDAEGYYRTGDIYEQRGPDTYVWLDRKSNVLKLSQGQFVNLSHLDALFSLNSLYIQQIYVHGTSDRSYLLAVVVPNREAVREYCHQQGLAETWNEELLKQLVRRELEAIAARENLPSYELPRDVLIEAEPFSQANGLLTDSNKLARPRLRKRYGEQLTRLYEQLDSVRSASVEALRPLPPRERMVGIIEHLLGRRVQPEELRTVSFALLGGDSLGATELCALVQQLCGVSLPVSRVLDRNSTLQSLIDFVEEAATREERETFERIHGTRTPLASEEVRLSLFLSREELERLPRALPRPAGEARCVLLTGADGFVGHILLLELLRQLPEEARIICLGHAPDEATARRQLESRYDTDAMLRARFQALTAPPGRLRVVAGDLSRPLLGLSPGQYQRLAAEVDQVLHAGALVNHLLSYRQLFEPNVHGTVELIRFALADRPKPLAFLSSVAAVSGCGAPVLREGDDPRKLFRERALDTKGYAAGYGLSKWVCELLLEDLSEKTGLLVQVFRCGLILGHAEAPGQLNSRDVFARSLAAMLNTGMASRALLLGLVDGIPVDTVARGIVEVSRHVASEPKAFSVYHVTPDADAGGRHAFEWLQSYTRGRLRLEETEGLSVAWLEQWKARLESLPEKRRKHGEALLSLLRVVGTLPERAPRFDNAGFKARAHLSEVPHLSETLLSKYIDDLRLLGLVD